MKDILKAKYPWLDKDYVADVTRKQNVDAWKERYNEMWPLLDAVKEGDEPTILKRKDQ